MDLSFTKDITIIFKSSLPIENQDKIIYNSIYNAFREVRVLPIETMMLFLSTSTCLQDHNLHDFQVTNYSKFESQTLNRLQIF